MVLIHPEFCDFCNDFDLILFFFWYKLEYAVECYISFDFILFFFWYKLKYVVDLYNLTTFYQF